MAEPRPVTLQPLQQPAPIPLNAQASIRPPAQATQFYTGGVADGPLLVYRDLSDFVWWRERVGALRSWREYVDIYKLHTRHPPTAHGLRTKHSNAGKGKFRLETWHYDHRLNLPPDPPDPVRGAPILTPTEADHPDATPQKVSAVVFARIYNVQPPLARALVKLYKRERFTMTEWSKKLKEL